MDKLLKKDAKFYWDEERKCILDVLKEKMVTALILVFQDWKKEFHVHMDASRIVLGVVLMQTFEGEVDHLIAFAGRKLSKAKKSYSTIEREGLAMEYEFEVIVKPGSLNTRFGHLSQIKIGEEPTNLEEGFPYGQLFIVHVAENNFANIIHFLTMRMAPKGYTSQQSKELVVCMVDFSMIVGHLYKMGAEEILRRYVPDFERNNILSEAHGGATGGHYAGKGTTQKILRAGL
eukprot:PITA_12745